MNVSEWILKTLNKIFGGEYVPPAEDLAKEMELNGELTLKGDLVVVHIKADGTTTTTRA